MFASALKLSEKRMKKIDFSLILPCYNEGPTFEGNVELILKELKKLRTSWEIFFVEDKSEDDTKASVEEIVKKVKNCSAIYHRKNEGRGKSVKDGITASRGAICGFMDVDCEISPAYIPIFVSEAEKGYDVVVAQRFYESKLRFLNRVVASKLYSLIVKRFLNIPIRDTEAGFKFFNRLKILPVIAKTYDKGWFWDTEICAVSHVMELKIAQVPVLFIKRNDKKSTVKILGDSIDYMIKIIRFKKEFEKMKSRTN